MPLVSGAIIGSAQLMKQYELRLTQDYNDEGWSSRDLHHACTGGTLERLRRGVYAVPGNPTPEDRHRIASTAALALRVPGTAISHVSAAIMHNLPVRRAALSLAHLTRSFGSHGRKEAGVHLHHCQLAPAEVVEIDGVLVTSLERTLADTARQESFAWAVVLMDAGLARQADAGLLLHYAQTGSRRPGNRNLKRTLVFADGLSGSPAESLSRVSMQRAGVPAPELQFDVVSPQGEWIATADFGWPEFGVIGEVDGRIKYDSPDRGRQASDVVAQEKQREELIRACGWWVTRWGWDIALDHHRLGEQLHQAFRAAQTRQAA